MRRAGMVAVVAVLAGVGIACSPVDAATRCTEKTASGTGPTEQVAKFQVYEGLLASVDESLWSAWMATGTTPGYRVSAPVYVCRAGMGLGVSCQGRAKICKR
jgi:hypothetical protein